MTMIIQAADLGKIEVGDFAPPSPQSQLTFQNILMDLLNPEEVGNSFLDSSAIESFSEHDFKSIDESAIPAQYPFQTLPPFFLETFYDQDKVSKNLFISPVDPPEKIDTLSGIESVLTEPATLSEMAFTKSLLKDFSEDPTTKPILMPPPIVSHQEIEKASKIVEHVIGEMNHNIKEGESKFSIQLEPDHLGHVEIEMIFKDNVVIAVLTADSDAAYSSLQQRAHFLENKLKEFSPDKEIQMEFDFKDSSHQNSREHKSARSHEEFFSPIILVEEGLTNLYHIIA